MDSQEEFLCRAVFRGKGAKEALAPQKIFMEKFSPTPPSDFMEVKSGEIGKNKEKLAKYCIVLFAIDSVTRAYSP